LFVVLSLVACQPTRAPSREFGPVVIADTPPPPIRGGGLLLLADANTLVVSDADRDRIVLFDLAARRTLREIDLDAGAEPGRAVQTPDGHVHVVLRGAGSVLGFDPTAPDVRVARSVCPMPAGIAYDATVDRLRVACASGELVTFGSDPSTPLSSVFVERDLRDVVVAGGRVYATSFRAADLLEIDPITGAVGPRTSARDATYFDGETEVPFRHEVAWRAIPIPGAPTSVLLLHQRRRVASVALHPVVVDGGGIDAGVLEGAYDQHFGAPSGGPDAGMPAGTVLDDGACDSIVRTTLSIVDLTSMTVSQAVASITDARLAVDIAVTAVDASDQTFSVVVANAGVGDGGGGVAFARGDFARVLIGPGACTAPAGDMGIDVHAAVAVTVDASGMPIVLEREPMSIVYRGTRTPLGGASAFDTGHALFHTTTQARIACASCHPEGREDGQTWTFDGSPRRTQSLVGGLLATAPFHWDGDEHAIRDVVDDVFTHRMSGPALDDEHVAAIAAWLDQLPAPTAAIPDVGAATRGRALFEGVAGCTSCHGGPHFTNNRMEVVGLGSAQQVPSLVGVSHRLPLMRTGCATTLRDRFEPSCGGASHGTTSTLAPADIDDLIAYLGAL
jgi:hypothetical protein